MRIFVGMYTQQYIICHISTLLILDILGEAEQLSQGKAFTDIQGFVFCVYKD